MKNYAIKYSIYASEEILTYSSIWNCLATSLEEAKNVVYGKLLKRYPLCRVSV